jgi:hypothetical protein
MYMNAVTHLATQLSDKARSPATSRCSLMNLMHANHAYTHASVHHCLAPRLS